MVLPKYNIKLSIFLPHTKVYGGVRHFVEVGNIFSKNGYCYTIYTHDGEKPDWIDYYGDIKSLEAAANDSHDVVITGDVGMLEVVKRINANVKIIYVLGPRYINEYNKYLSCFQVWVGISNDWLEYFSPPESAYYYTNPLGVNRQIFSPRCNNKNNQKGSDYIYILCFGRINKKIKGVLDILKAFKALKDSRAKLMMFDSNHIHLPWWSNLNIKFKRRIERYLIHDQEELVALYNKADIFISAERTSGWSNTSAEAMACKTAVICTPCGTRDFAIDKETALVVPVGRPDKIKEAVELLINSSDLRARLAENGFNKIQQFTWEAHCMCLLEIIREVKKL
ncbi:MAG: hypothetical protein DRG39_08275 [Deltaproteobacteria bacterium]|nr:MAG: hypothetical protein DRG39_08275 [Deltaproteobacteria bacterium]